MATLASRIGGVLVGRLGMSRRSLNIIRHEVRTMRIAFGNMFNHRKRATIDRMQKSLELSVNIGSGGCGLPDWVNVDVSPGPNTTILLDIRKRLPFADGSVRRLFSEHVIEHLDFAEDIPNVFAEFHRVLAPGGVLRIIVPDAGRFLTAYVQKDRSQWQSLGWELDVFPADIHSSMHVVNHIFHQGGEHLFGYDFDTMSLMLRKAGFKTVLQQPFGVSVDPALAIDQEIHKHHSLYVDAVR
jgi:predicted SAM-dependent methyltransferase